MVNSTYWLTQSAFARRADVRPSFITQLIKDARIPEAVRDEKDRYRLPNRRCIIPPRYPRRGGKINDLYFRRDEIPEEWIYDPDSRPGSYDEKGGFVGVSLEGDEDEPLSERIEKTFGVTVGSEETTDQPDEDTNGKAAKGWFPDLFLQDKIRVGSRAPEMVEGTLLEANERGIVIIREAPLLPREETQAEGETGRFMVFLPWSVTAFIETQLA